MKNGQTFKRSALFAALTTALYQPLVVAAEEEAVDEGIEKIQVTATRRSATVQEIPVNITALDGDIMADQNIGELSDIARWVPGLTIQDQGGRQASPIIVRGLNTNTSGPGTDGGTVATYIGESPLQVDLKILDVQRVEVLIGPQGTLYGAGTLGGAIRYIPNKPEMDAMTGKVYGELNTVSEGDQGHEAGFVFNLPITDDELAMRVAFQTQKNAGFIDYNYLVKEGGVSLPDPDWSDASAVSANLTQSADQNYDETDTAKFMLRWMPNDKLDALLSYTYQNQEVGGRSIVHYGTLSEDNGLSDIIGKYESGYRYVEPRETTTDLLALEITADLGFAELTSATSFSTFEDDGQRDQTDLLIRLDYSYEEFPAFSSFTREQGEEENFVQELRLVSTIDSDLSWIVGAYYSDFHDEGSSKEFTPEYDQFRIANPWVWLGEDQASVPRPDDLEYISVDDIDVTESAIFGEVSYAVNDKLDVTAGFRAYSYEVSAKSDTQFPLLETVGFGADANDDFINLADAEAETAEDDGTLLKFNVSYKFSNDFMAYLTLSEGFRIGGSNGVPECTQEQLDDDKQDTCALPSEVVYVADTTENIELGFKSTWNNNRIHLNGAIFKVDWNDPQIAGATQNGQQPITANGKGAESTGFELSARAMITDELTLFGSFAHTEAKLSADAPYLFGVFDEQGSTLQNWKDGKNGDRLPGSPENQASLGVKYTTDVLGEYLVDVNYGVTYQSDLITTVGMRNDGEEIDGYSLSNLSVRFSAESWAVTAYIDNLFDEYAVTSVRRNKQDIGLSRYDDYNQNGAEISRNYGYYITTPRTIGVKFEYNFEEF